MKSQDLLMKDNQVLRFENIRLGFFVESEEVTDLESLLSVLFAGEEPHLCIHVHE
jgi:hypothetical protein